MEQAQNTRNTQKGKTAIQSLALEVPQSGHLCAVDEDIFWLRMPLPFDLDHINLYLIKDGDAYAAIDTGIGTSTTQDLWDQIFKRISAPLSKVIVTHMHPDHIGMAGYLVDRFKVPLYMTFSEYFAARALVAGPRGAPDWQDKAYLQHCGMDQAYIEQASKNKGGISKVVKPIPLSYKRLHEHQNIQIGKYQWQVLIGRGHSPEHACLYCEKKNVLISGDHVLPNISPNIGAYSTEPEANPLEYYLATLKQFKSLSADTVVLPSHKLPFIGLHQRVDELVSHHHAHLAALLKACKQARTVKQCLPVLFDRELNPHNLFFAIAEALAHLNYLVYCGQCTRELNDKGQWLFKAR